MVKQNTTAKGNLFEDKVYDLFNELISTGDFYLNSRSSKIFKKKKYYSAARNDTITVDISIESYIGDTDVYSSLTIIECKDYSKNVPVDDIEEFCYKLNQIGEQNTKGFVVTNSSFQSGAINIAKSKGLGLVRINQNQEFEWINRRVDRKSKYLDFSYTQEQLCIKVLKEINFVGFFGHVGYDSLSQMFVDMRIIDRFNNNSKFIKFPFISKEAIDKKIESLPNDIIYDIGKLNSERLCEYISKTYNAQFDFKTQLLDNSKFVLGKISFNPLMISVSSILIQDDYRWRFTLAHEIGHLILHSSKLMAYFEEYSDSDNSIINNQGVTDIQKSRLEIQANLFASHLLIPQDNLTLLVHHYFLKENINKGFIVFDEQPCNRALTMNLLYEIHRKFGVSKEVAKYRLIESKYLADNTETSIRSIMDKEFK